MPLTSCPLTAYQAEHDFKLASRLKGSCDSAQQEQLQRFIGVIVCVSPQKVPQTETDSLCPVPHKGIEIVPDGMQETPRILQGRVFASRSMIARCFVPLSYVVVGPLVDIVLPKLLQSNLGLIINVVGTQALEYRLVFCGAGVLCVLITCCVAANTNFRKL